MARADSTMPTRLAPYEPNRILRWFYDRFFSHIVVDDRWQGVVHHAADRGVVVYVMRSLSFLDFLCLDYLTKRFGLPLIRFVNDLGLSVLEPFGRGRRRLRFRRQIPQDRALSKTVKGHYSALLFLRRPPRIFRWRRGRGEPHRVDLIRTLIEIQRQIKKPILLVPQTFVWSKLPPNKRQSVLDLFFGPSDWPGKVRVAFQFLLNYRNAVLRAGEPFDLQAFCEQHPDFTDRQMADQVRYAMLRIMERERSLVLGPSKKTPGRIRDELLRSPRVLKHIRAHARATHKSVARVLRAARRDLKRLTASPNPYIIAMMKVVLDRVWNRIYDGMEEDKEGIEQVRQAAREGTLILMPSHKSHIDYLILSDVLYRHALSPPLIAAGDNLNFFPIGTLLRRGGAFFIRRTFKGKRLYAALVDAYLRKLIVEGFNIEFFVEGGRSRTGKLLAPKLGLLSMIVDAGLLLPGKRVSFVPVSISYERVVEERAYVHEAQGGEKRKESIGELLRSSRILGSRFGRLYVQFGSVLPLEDLKHEILGEGAAKTPLTAPQRRLLVQKTAFRVIDQINRVTMVTPSALVASAFLCHPRSGIGAAEFQQRCGSLIPALRQENARFAKSLLDPSGELRQETLSATLDLFLRWKFLVREGSGPDAHYAVPDERRLALEYYKNNVLHFFVARALISTIVVTGNPRGITRPALSEAVQELSRLFKHEFFYQADATFDENFQDQFEKMVNLGELVEEDQMVKAAPTEAGARVQLYGNMIRTYFESGRLATRAVSLLNLGPVPKSIWVRKTLSLGRRMYLTGELKLSESLSKHRLENALLALRDRKVVRAGPGDVLELVASEDEVERLESELLRLTP